MSEADYAAAAEADPEGVAADNAIRDFRSAHSEALMNTGHVDHDRRVNELKMMFEGRYPEQPEFDPGTGGERPANTLDQMAEEAMQPCDADEFPISVDSDFGQNVDTATYGWDAQLESAARQTMAAAGLNRAQGRLAADIYYETCKPSFDRTASWKQSMALVSSQYGSRARAAVEGANRMISHLAGAQMNSFLARSGVGCHPRFVGEAVRLARQRGYF